MPTSTTIHDSPLDPRLVLKRTSPSTPPLAMYAPPSLTGAGRRFFFSVRSVFDDSGLPVPVEELERKLPQMWAGGCALLGNGGIRVRAHRFLPYEALHVMGTVVDEAE